MQELHIQSRTANLGVRDTVTPRGQKAANELRHLPGVKTRLKKIVPQTHQICCGKLFHDPTVRSLQALFLTEALEQ
jgi:hypothetical protein